MVGIWEGNAWQEGGGDSLTDSSDSSVDFGNNRFANDHIVSFLFSANAVWVEHRNAGRPPFRPSVLPSFRPSVRRLTCERDILRTA